MPPRLPDPSGPPDPAAVAAARARAQAAAEACDRTAAVLRSTGADGRQAADRARRDWAGGTRRDFDEALRALDAEDARHEGELRALGRAWRDWALALGRAG